MVKFVKTSQKDIPEKEIQRAFEENLNELEDGLEFIASFLSVGTGIIDTLAVDEDDNAVIIEFKKMGDFDQDALIQLMDYYSWFVMDENHQNYLNEIIRKKKPKFSSINNLRLIAVVSHVNDRIKNACWALTPSIKLVSYSLFEDSKGEVHVIPKEILDTSKGGEKLVRPPKTEEEHLKKYSDMKPLYLLLKEKILEIDKNIIFNPAPQNYIGFRRNRMFVTVRIYRDNIWLDLRIKPKDVNNNPRIKDWVPSKDWSYCEIYFKKEINDELMNLIRICYEKN